MTLYAYSLFVIFGPVIAAFIPKIFGDVSLLWFAFYLLIILFFLRTMISKEARLSVNVWILIMAFTYLVIFASISWSEHYNYDVETLKRIFAHYFVPLTTAFIALNTIRTEKDIKSIVRCIFVSATILSLLSICQMIFGFQTLFRPDTAGETYRSSATFSNPNGLALFLALCIPHILYGWNRRILSINKTILSLSCISGGVICTVSRKGMASAVLAFFLYFILKKKYSYLLACALLTLLAAAVIHSSPLMSQRFTQERLAVQFEGKRNMVIAGIDMFLRNPLIGLGYQGYYENFRKYFPNSPKKKYDAHNIYVTVLANTGLLGFIPFMAIFLHPLIIAARALVRSSSRHDADIAIISIISIITFMMSGYYGGGLFVFYPITMLFYTNVALLFSCNRPSKGCESRMITAHPRDSAFRIK